MAGSSATAPFLQPESNESAAGAASASAPSKTREEKKSEESQGSSLGPPGPPPGPRLLREKSSDTEVRLEQESAPARRTTGAEFLSEGRKEKRPLSADKGAKSGSADTGRIASTSGSSSAGASTHRRCALGASAAVKTESQSAVARLQKYLSEAASSGKLAKGPFG